MNKKLLLLFLFCSLISFSQNIERVNVMGKIIVDVKDVEGVTIFNLSANKGTVTNEKGEFNLDIALNDKIEVSAVQFIPFTFKVEQNSIDTKQLVVYLVERVNNLDEVVLLSQELTGDLEGDAESVKVVQPFIFEMPQSLSDLELPEDNKTGVVNTALVQPIRYQADMGEVIKLVSKLFKSNKPKFYPEVAKYSSILDAYSVNYLSKVLDLSAEDIDPFLAFIETENFDYMLLNKENEIQFIDYILKQKPIYLASLNEKD